MKALARHFSYLLWIATLSASANIVSTNPVAPPTQIVMCRDAMDLDGLIGDFKLPPKFVYRRLKGFATAMDAATVEKVKLDGRVRSVGADEQAGLCGQVIPSGLVRIGAEHFPVAHINGTPKSLNVDVAVMDTGIGPHPDLNVYQWFSLVDDNGDDINGHGTFVAGISGATDNGFGVVGVAPGVRIWAVKFT